MATILVVEDQETLRTLLRVILQRDGHDVLEADNGRAGLEAYRRQRADLIITDIVMPVMNGLDFISEVTASCSEARVIAMTGASDEEKTLVKARAVGARDTLKKPFTIEKLLMMVRSELAR